jgi:hypothetical protein
MSISYNVYKNDGAGGPVDYSTVMANTSSLSYSPSALDLGSDNLFAVRALDSVTGLADMNVDAVVRIVVDAAGADVTNRPPPSANVASVARAGGKALVTWTYNRLAAGGIPTGFKIWLTAGSSVNYGTSPAVTIPYTDEPAGIFTATLSGLTDGTTYSIGVRTYTATGLSAVAANEPQIVGRVSTAPSPAEDGSSSVGFAP